MRADLDVQMRDQRAERLRERVRDLTHAAEGVHAELELMIYRTHQAGVPTTEIADLALEDVSRVESMIADCQRDPDIDALSEGPDWVPFHRHDGYRVSA